MSDRGAFWKLKEAQGDYVCAENSAFRRDVPALWRPWRLSQASCRAITCLTGLEAAGQRGASSMHAHYMHDLGRGRVSHLSPLPGKNLTPKMFAACSVRSITGPISASGKRHRQTCSTSCMLRHDSNKKFEVYTHSPHENLSSQKDTFRSSDAEARKFPS